MNVQIKKDDNILLSPITKNKLDADYVYFPYQKDIKLKVKLDEYIFLEQNIFDNKDIPVYSSISGVVKGSKKLIDANNKIINTIVIENDFKEKKLNKKGIKRNISNYTKEEVYAKIKTCLDYKFAKNLECSNLFISSLDIDPYEANELFILNDYVDQILETVDALLDIYEIQNAYILVKNKESETITKILNKLGTYPKIHLKIIEDFYPLGIERVLENYLKIKNICILKTSFIYNLYKALKKDNKVTEKYITISGNAIKNPIIVNVKIGTKAIDIINDLVKFKKDIKDYVYIANGLMAGKIIDINKLVVTDDLRSIIINQIEERESLECINCGMCKQVCPMNLNPREYLHKKVVPNCLKCNLCSYICPAKINLIKEDDYSDK